jgi:hypothetical protein
MAPCGLRPSDLKCSTIGTSPLDVLHGHIWSYDKYMCPRDNRWIEFPMHGGHMAWVYGEWCD